MLHAIFPYKAEFKLSHLLLPLLAITLGVSSGVRAETTRDLFLPDQLNYYNPLTHNAAGTRKATHNDAYSAGLDNRSLEQAAALIREHGTRAEVRALNHQWLLQNRDESDLHVGTRVISHIAKMGFKTYWKGLRNRGMSNKALPDSNGNGKLSSAVDYKFRVSDDKVRLLFEYEF